MTKTNMNKKFTNFGIPCKEENQSYMVIPVADSVLENLGLTDTDEEDVDEEENSKHDRKIFVLDTSVLLYDKDSMFKLKGNNLFIPFVVLEELDKFKDKSYVTYEQPINTMLGRKDFLRKIKQHSFVICPRGNGIDTHRLYETLYMGSIPITEYNDIYANLLDLPILFITDWNMVTEEYLINKLKEMKTRKFNMNKLYTKYWYSIMLNKIKS